MLFGYGRFAIAAVGCCFRDVMRFSLGRAITAVCRFHRCRAFNFGDKVWPFGFERRMDKIKTEFTRAAEKPSKDPTFSSGSLHLQTTSKRPVSSIKETNLPLTTPATV